MSTLSNASVQLKDEKTIQTISCFRKLLTF